MCFYYLGIDRLGSDHTCSYKFILLLHCQSNNPIRIEAAIACMSMGSITNADEVAVVVELAGAFVAGVAGDLVVGDGVLFAWGVLVVALGVLVAAVEGVGAGAFDVLAGTEGSGVLVTVAGEGVGVVLVLPVVGDSVVDEGVSDVGSGVPLTKHSLKLPSKHEYIP